MKTEPSYSKERKRLEWKFDSVVLEQRKQIVTAVVGKVRRAQIGQQLIWVGQLRKKLDDR